MSEMGMPAPVSALFGQFRRFFHAFEHRRDEDHENETFTAEWALRFRTEADEVDGGWTAWVVDLPGCVSEGDTEEEALENLMEAFRGVLAVQLEDAMPESEPTDDGEIKTRTVAFG